MLAACLEVARPIVLSLLIIVIVFLPLVHAAGGRREDVSAPGPDDGLRHVRFHALCDPAGARLEQPSHAPAVLNIDGQAVVWKVDGREETIPAYFEKGGRDPEGGTGVRYAIQKKIRLAGGSHRLYFGLPAEGYYREFDVTVKEGGTYALAFEPVYEQIIPNLQRIPDIRRFTNGFDRYERAWTEIRPEPEGQTGPQ